MVNTVSTIKSLRVRAVRVPMVTPHRTASGVITESPLILTDIETSDGVIGHSMIFTYTAIALKPTAEFIKNLGVLIIGEALAPLEIEQKLKKQFRLLGIQGLVGMALSAIDMSLWDALSRTNNQTLIQQLGGNEKPIKAYGAVGFDGVLGSANTAESWAIKGFKGVKAKIGYQTVKEDVNVIRAMQNAVGNDVAVMVDYNQCLTPHEAIQRMRILDDEGLAWVEEPTLAHDFIGNAQVTRESKTAIQSGENWWGTLDMIHAIEARASNLIMPDVMKIGGVTGWMHAAAIAQTHNIQLSNHLWPEISTQLLCLTPTAHWLEYSDWWNPILAEPLEIEGGVTVLGNATGTGVSWDESAVEKYIV